jgi:hypothetical protein
MRETAHYFGPTENRMWEPQTILANFLMLGLPVLVTLGLVVATEVQREQMNAKQQAAVAACNSEADKATTDQTQRGEAYLTCMDHRPITQPTIERVKPAGTAAG